MANVNILSHEELVNLINLNNVAIRTLVNGSKHVIDECDDLMSSIFENTNINIKDDEEK